MNLLKSLAEAGQVQIPVTNDPQRTHSAASKTLRNGTSSGDMSSSSSSVITSSENGAEHTSSAKED